MSISVGCVPLQWGRFKYERERVLREVKEAGFDALSTGPQSGKSPAEVVKYLSDFGLAPAPGYIGGDWWKPDEAGKAVESAARHADFSREAGLSECFISAGGFGNYASRRNGKTRQELSGQVQDGDGMTDDEWKVLADTVNRIGAAMAQEGVAACYHNHVGAVVETREEMEKLIAMTDSSVVFLGPDTGHLFWAGADPVAFFRDFAPQIRAVHLKDASKEVRAFGVDKGWNYGQFSEAGLWRELGEGDIDFAAIFDILRQSNFNGWALSETDVTKKDTPLESARVCREYLQNLGL